MELPSGWALGILPKCMLQLIRDGPGCVLGSSGVFLDNTGSSRIWKKEPGVIIVFALATFWLVLHVSARSLFLLVMNFSGCWK